MKKIVANTTFLAETVSLRGRCINGVLVTHGCEEVEMGSSDAVPIRKEVEREGRNGGGEMDIVHHISESMSHPGRNASKPQEDIDDMPNVRRFLQKKRDRVYGPWKLNDLLSGAPKGRARLIRPPGRNDSNLLCIHM